MLAHFPPYSLTMGGVANNAPPYLHPHSSESIPV